LFESRAGNFETDEVVIAVWSVAFAGDLENVKTKFGFYMGQPIVLKCNAVAVFLSEAGLQNRDGPIGADAVTVVVRSVMGERADGESELVEILGVSQQSLDEIAASDVMREVTKERTAVRVVPHILNDGTTVGEGLRPAQIFLGCLREFIQKERLDVRLPDGIDDGLMRQNSVGTNGSWRGQQNG